MRVAMIGTRGVPARYGGFETAVEEIGRRLVDRGHDVVVYCRGGDGRADHQGMRLVHLPAVPSKSAETLSHTALSVMHLLRHPVDVSLIFNAANAIFLPAIRGHKAIHVDGLEWQRAKWGPMGRRFYLASERLAVRWAHELIADAHGIQDYYRDTYARDTRYIAYGAPIQSPILSHRLPDLGLTSKGYHLLVARFEPENNVDVLVRGYVASRAELPLVVVGSAPYADQYVDRVRAAASDPRVRLVGAVWDQEQLDQLYSNCASYLHGHSVGGTNPSLLRAMGAAAPVIALDVTFCREVVGPDGRFFSNEADVAALVEEVEADRAAAEERGRRGQGRAATSYRWDDVAADYEKLCVDLVARAG